MVVPMFLGMLIYSFFPEVLEIGSFTTATFSHEAASTVMGVQLFCLGSQLQLKEMKTVARRGGVLLVSKLVLGILSVLLIKNIFGNQGIWGISLLAVCCSITNVNGSIYLSLVSVYGDEADGATVPVLALTNGPFLTLIVLGISGAAHFSPISLIATVVPVAVGMLLGNISGEIKNFLKPGIQLLLPFIGFTLGAGIDVKTVFRAGAAGLLLSVFVIVVGGIFTYFCDRVFAGRPGYAGLASCATGANAIGVPAAIALADPVWNMYVAEAAAQIAAAVVVSALVIPFLVEKTKKRESLQKE